MKVASSATTLFGQDLAGAEESLAAQIEILEFVANAFQGRDGFEDFDGFGGDFRAGPVAAHYGDAKNVVAAQRLMEIVSKILFETLELRKKPRIIRYTNSAARNQLPFQRTGSNAFIR